MAETVSKIQISVDSDSVYLHIPYDFFWQCKANENLLHKLKKSVPHGVINIRDPDDRVKTRLYNAGTLINRKISSIRGGRQREDVRKKTYKLCLDYSEVSNSQVGATIVAQCDDLKLQLETTKQELDSQKKKVEKLETTNKQLSDYIQHKLALVFPKQGYAKKGLQEVGERQRQRRIKQIEQNVDSELWFLKAFGIDLEYVQAKDHEGRSLKLCAKDSSKSYEHLSETDKENVQSILNIMDRYCIGDAAYHEITMADDNDLPRSYLVKQCRADLNKCFHIERTPGIEQGVQLSFVDELCTVISERKLKGTVRVKISGDGAQMSKRSSFTTISFAVLTADEDVSQVGTVYPIAIIKAPESYEMLESCAKDVFGEINAVNKEGFIEVDGARVEVELFLGADYKFLLLVLGLSGATSNFSCVWCKIPKTERYDMSKPENHYWEDDHKRSIQDLVDCAKKQSFSSKHSPLLHIPLDHVVVDELHLLLRISDILLENQLSLVLDQDKRKEFLANSTKGLKSINAFESAVQSCGVSFRIWEKMNADGSGSGSYQFTSLGGDDKKKVLRRLPSVFTSFIHDPDIARTIQDLWSSFVSLYETLSTFKPTDNEIDMFFTNVRNWINDFLKMGGKVPGFEKRRVTPYMHLLAYHVPMWLRRHRNVRQFTGQIVEKKNDDIRKVHNLKSSHYDSSFEAMAACKRLQMLSVRTRPKRRYTNPSTSGTTDTKKKRKTVGIDIRADTVRHLKRKSELLEESVVSLKAQLKALGVHSNLKNKEKLVKQLMSVENKEN